MAAAGASEGACPSAAAMTKFAQCLSLERPESYSSVGKAADASVHVTRFPQPMIYSPAAGLVIYEPPGTMGVAQMEWLDKLSSPKAPRPKSPKVARQPAQQQHWRPPSPTDSRHSHQQQQQQQQIVSLGGASTSSMPPPQSAMPLLQSRQRSPQITSSATSGQQQMLQIEPHWGSKMLESQLPNSSAGMRSKSPNSSAVSRSKSPQAASGSGSGGTTDWLRTAPGSQPAASAGDVQTEAVSQRGVRGHRNASQHSSVQQPHSKSPGQQAAVVSDRVTLTQPYVFRWGGRINSKHRPLCEMHRNLSPEHTHQHGASSTHRRSGGSITTQQRPQQTAADEGTAAAAVELGARADKLMKLLELRVPRQHSAKGKRRPMSGRMQRLQQQDGDATSVDSLEYELGDEPIGVPQEYLRL